VPGIPLLPSEAFTPTADGLPVQQQHYNFRDIRGIKKHTAGTARLRP